MGANNYHTATCLLGLPDFDNTQFVSSVFSFFFFLPFLPRKVLNTRFIGSPKMSIYKRFMDKNLERRQGLEIVLDGCVCKTKIQLCT